MHRPVPALVLFALAVAGCSAENNADNAAEEDPLSLLDASYVEEIEGHEGHNILARADRLERGMALANVVKKVEGKQYCSPERTFFRGAEAGISVWAIQCHDGPAYQVTSNKDGTGGIVACSILDRLEGVGACWKPFADKPSFSNKNSGNKAETDASIS